VVGKDTEKGEIWLRNYPKSAGERGKKNGGGFRGGRGYLRRGGEETQRKGRRKEGKTHEKGVRETLDQRKYKKEGNNEGWGKREAGKE